MFLTKLKRKILSNTRLSRFLLLVFPAILLIVGIKYLLLPQLPALVRSGTKIILNENPDFLKNDNGRTNILLLGIGGASHDGPDLTDTMIVMSLMTKFPNNEASPPAVLLISIPRDIYLDSLGGKINEAYSDGLSKGAGLALAKESVAQVTGLSIHYAVQVDFSVFEKVVDILGGIDVNVANTLDDYLYPIDGKESDICGFSPSEAAAKASSATDEVSAAQAFPCRYEHLHFDPGLQHMDGKTALKFVRSRHAQWPENSDFARSKRQQLVIKAVKDKIFSSQNFLNISKDFEIYNQLKANIDTDFDLSQPKNLLALGLKYKNAQFKNIALDESLLVNPPDDGRGWILLPKDGNWNQIHDYIASQTAILKY